MKLSSQMGFTLVEIIAVLVILGILAAVAIPKYMGMQEQARLKAVEGALAEGKGRVSLYLSKQLLSNNGTINTPAFTNANLGSDAGDFTLNFSVGDSVVSITASGTGGTIPAAVSATGAVILPTGRP